MADYDSGEVTEREELAADRQKEIARFNEQAIRNQLNRQIGNYDFANRQNRKLADLQLKQNQRKTESDRFEAQRNLQNATVGLLGSMNQAMNGSSVGNLMRMLENRNDADNNTYWTQHQVNQDTVNNAYEESVNQNQVSKLDAAQAAEKGIRDIESDLAANLSNINPNLYVAPGTGDARLNSETAWNDRHIYENNPKLSGYIMPDNSVQAARSIAGRNTLRGGDYYSKLINSLNRR